MSYLLEVVEGLKDAVEEDRSEALTEWQIYKLIVDQLMLRDFKRSPEIHPHRRRLFLRTLAIFLSSRENPVVSEDDFRDIVAKEFQKEIRRYPKETQSGFVEQLFSDLRSSATLTRGGRGLEYGWRFSHNSLREFLVAEALVSSLEEHRLIARTVPISDAMRIFASSIALEERERLGEQLARAWRNLDMLDGRGQLLALLWEGLITLQPKTTNQRESCLKAIAGEPPSMSEVMLAHLQISSETDPTSLENGDFSRAALSDVEFCGANLRGADFSNSSIESVAFEGSDLRGANFTNTFIVDSKFSGALLVDADFRGVDPTGISILIESDGEPGKRVLDGRDALGYLRFVGSKTDEMPAIYELQHHPAFPVTDKILGKLTQQSLRQRRGLEQRGAARQDVRLARGFVKHLENKGLLVTPRNRKDLVQVTDRGREVFAMYAAHKEFSEELISFFGEKG